MYLASLQAIEVILLLIEPVVDILLFGVLQFGQNPALVDCDMLVFVVDQRSQEIQHMCFVVILNGHFVDHFRNLYSGLLHVDFVVEDVFVIVEQL